MVPLQFLIQQRQGIALRSLLIAWIGGTPCARSLDVSLVLDLESSRLNVQCLGRELVVDSTESASPLIEKAPANLRWQIV